MKANLSSFNINGTNLGHYKMQGLQAAVIDCQFKAGSIYESPEEWGTLHLLEHMLFTKSRSFKDSLSLEQYKEEYGISNNGWTGSGVMGFWFKFPYLTLKETLFLLEDMLFYPIFSEKNLEKEKSIINQEYIDKYSSPYQRFYRAVMKQLYGSVHPYMRDGIGNPENIKNVSVNDLIKLHQKFIVPANLFIGYAGKNTAKTITTQFEKILSSKESGKQQIEKVSAVQPETNYLWHKEDVDQVQIRISWKLPGLRELKLENIVRLNVARYLIGGSARSLVYQRLRDDLGLVYDAGASLSWWEEVSYFSVHASTSRKNASKVYEELIKLTNTFVNDPIPLDTFNRSIKYMNTQTLLRYDSVGNISEALAGSLLNHGRLISAEEYISMANTFREEELRGLLKLGINTDISPYVSVLSRNDPRLVTIT